MLMRIKNILLTVVGLCLAFTITSSRADIVLSNTNAAHSVSFIASLTDWYASPFTIDSSSDYSINAITLAFVLPDAIGAPGLTGEIRINNSGAPGAWVEDLSIIGGVDGGETTLLNLNASPAILSASTSYFFVFGVSPGIGNTYQVSVSDDKTADVGSTWTQGDGYHLSSNGGSSWSPETDYQTRLSIDAVAVPEPSVLALISIAGLGTLVGRRLIS